MKVSRISFFSSQERLQKIDQIFEQLSSFFFPSGKTSYKLQKLRDTLKKEGITVSKELAEIKEKYVEPSTNQPKEGQEEAMNSAFRALVLKTFEIQILPFCKKEFESAPMSMEAWDFLAPFITDLEEVPEPSPVIPLHSEV